MKATMEIPDELYRRVKARSALLGVSVREVTTELYQRWLGDLPPEGTASGAKEWVEDWLALGREAAGKAAEAESSETHAGGPEGPTGTEILERDRARLDPC